MKLNKTLFTLLIAGVAGGMATSCSDSFLDEELITQPSTDRFKTQEGLDELVTGAYQKLKFKLLFLTLRKFYLTYIIIMVCVNIRKR